MTILPAACGSNDSDQPLLGPADVVCGRTSLARAHPGNRRFRRLISKYGTVYQNAKNRKAKKEITTKIIRAIIDEGGKFLKATCPSPSFSPSSSISSSDDPLMHQDDAVLSTASEDFIYEKVSHALRSFRPASASSELRRNMMTASRNETPICTRSDSLSLTEPGNTTSCFKPQLTTIASNDTASNTSGVARIEGTHSPPPRSMLRLQHSEDSGCLPEENNIYMTPTQSFHRQACYYPRSCSSPPSHTVSSSFSPAAVTVSPAAVHAPSRALWFEPEAELLSLPPPPLVSSSTDNVVVRHYEQPYSCSYISADDSDEPPEDCEPFQLHADVRIDPAALPLLSRLF